ncbi:MULTISPECIES: hypothetical protein [unclassified Streptomyces]
MAALTTVLAIVLVPKRSASKESPMTVPRPESASPAARTDAAKRG